MEIKKIKNIFKGASTLVVLFPEKRSPSSDLFDRYRMKGPEEAAQADTQAIRRDWETVGRNIKYAIKKFGEIK